MNKIEHIEIKDNLELYNDDELRFIAKELNIENHDKLTRIDLIQEINKNQTKSTINNILRTLDSLRTVTGLTGVLLDFWFRAFIKNKWLTSVITIVLFVSLTITITYFENKEAAKIEQAKKESLELGNRINDLEKMEESLKSLITFIDNQKNAIIQTKQSIQELQKQKVELEPIILSQKETVEAIFREQDKRNFEYRLIERFIGFGLGVIASIIASILYGLIKRIATPKSTFA
jgi:hypothetical protein